MRASLSYPLLVLVVFFNVTATTEIYTLSLHDALPIYCAPGPVEPGTGQCRVPPVARRVRIRRRDADRHRYGGRRWHCRNRSEEHTSELQSQFHLVCRLLLEKKKTTTSASTRPSSTTTP